ncbi:MAG: 4Fe-4S dicluster domain-containing protein [Candidatus Bathyarchaeota archaeon]|nr:4Fe-4S dicluster domain-containing protein [Candidatus Bathyarchaeota archaeon]
MRLKRNKRLERGRLSTVHKEKTTFYMIHVSTFEGRRIVMHKRRLGRTGLQVSVVGFGGIPIIALSRERAERSLRFVLAHDMGTIIPGLRSTKEVDYVAKVAEDFKGLTDEEKIAYRFGELPPEPFCRERGLCMPCPDGVEIPTILRWDTYYSFHNIKRWTVEQYPKLRTRVNSCTERSECEEKCPYHLPVIKMLKDAERRLR